VPGAGLRGACADAATSRASTSCWCSTPRPRWARARAQGTIAERALKELGARIDDLPRGSRVTIVQSGAHPTLLAGPAAFPEEARDKLAAYAPLALRHDLSGAVAFALQVSGGGRVLVLTDRYEPERLPPEVEIVALGEPLDNVAITHASRERGRERATGTVRERASITLTNFSPRPARTQASVRSVDARDRELVDPKAIELAPGEKKLVAWDLPAGTPPIVIELAPDALEIDGQVIPRAAAGEDAGPVHDARARRNAALGALQWRHGVARSIARDRRGRRRGLQRRERAPRDRPRSGRRRPRELVPLDRGRGQRAQRTGSGPSCSSAATRCSRA
jgi:hypothetical protein